jgi:hypothetical protein
MSCRAFAAMSVNESGKASRNTPQHLATLTRANSNLARLQAHIQPLRELRQQCGQCHLGNKGKAGL